MAIPTLNVSDVPTGSAPSTSSAGTGSYGSLVAPGGKKHSYLDDLKAFISQLAQVSTTSTPLGLIEVGNPESDNYRGARVPRTTDIKDNQWPSPQMLEWQKLLIKSGLLSPKAKILAGYPDAATYNASERVFQFMSRTGMTDPYQALDAFGTSLAGSSAHARYLVPPVFRPSTDTDIRQFATTASQTELGRNPTAKEVAGVKGPVVGLEKQAYNQQYAGYQAKTAKAKTLPAQPTVGSNDYVAAAENALVGSAPTEAGGVDIRKALQGFLDAVRAG